MITRIWSVKTKFHNDYCDFAAQIFLLENRDVIRQSLITGIIELGAKFLQFSC